MDVVWHPKEILRFFPPFPQHVLFFPSQGLPNIPFEAIEEFYNAHL